MEQNKSKLPEVIYTPESGLNHPGHFIKDALRDLLASHELAWRLFVRNIKTLYRKTILGYLWAFLPPIVVTVSFVFLNDQQILNVGETTVAYPVYVLIGTILWQVFFESIFSPIKTINSSRAMLTKNNFPREALIMAGVMEVAFNFIVRLSLWITVVIIYKVDFPGTIFFTPIGIFFLLLFGVTIGILLTPLAVLYQDIERSLVIISSLWFFLTPVVYPPPTQGAAQLLVKYNPLTPLLVTTRDWALTGSPSLGLGAFCFVSALTLIFLILGWILYRLSMPHLIERIGF